MTTNFESKEHYLAFRKAWAKATQESKSHLEPCDLYVYELGHSGLRTGRYSVLSGAGKRRVKASVSRAHHILFNLLLNRPVETGFTPVTNKKKLLNGMYFNAGLYFAVHELKWFIDFDVKRSRRELDRYFKEENKQWAIQSVEKFLTPFNGTVTVDMLLALDIPKIEPMYSTFNKKGMEIIGKLDEIRPITYNQLYSLYIGETA